MCPLERAIAGALPFSFATITRTRPVFAPAAALLGGPGLFLRGDLCPARVAERVVGAVVKLISGESGCSVITFTGLTGGVWIRRLGGTTA